MNEPLDESYFKWLYAQVASAKLKNPARTYWSLIRHLFTKEYVWLVPNDDNRVEDGRDLRYEFIETNGIDPDLEWLGIGCSMLEMMIGLSRRLAFEADVEGEPRDWFWQLMENLDLRHFSDVNYNSQNKEQYNEVDEILDQVIWRTYEPDGTGGLFPLSEAHEDQRELEIWYQMSRYLLERV